MAPMQKVSDTPKSIKDAILIICGPTAAGKTKLAVSLAQTFDGELVNADSRQMYEGMDIISGKDIPLGIKPQVRERISIKGGDYPLVTYDMYGVPLWLYDVSPITRPLSISHFQTLATYVISSIQKRGKLPIIVGGTGFYLSSLAGTIPSLHIPQDSTLRDALDKTSVKDLQAMLLVENPDRWYAMNDSDRQNPRRLIRAIEVSRWNATHGAQVDMTPQYTAHWIGLRPKQKQLPSKIAKRVSDRFIGGAVEEVKQLGILSKNLPASSALGISVLQEYIQGRISADEAKRLWTTEELQYAKRQMVWFARQSNIHWFDADTKESLIMMEKLVHEWYT